MLNDTAEVIICNLDDMVRCTKLCGDKPCGRVTVVRDLIQENGPKLTNPGQQNSFWQTVYFCCPSCKQAKVFYWGDDTDLRLADNAELVYQVANT